MFGLFKSNPIDKLKKKTSKLYAEATEVQRSGDLKLYAKKMKEIDELEKEIEALKSS